MQSTIVIINLCGAVALLLFGLAQVKDGASRAFGARLRTSLATGTASGMRSFLSGIAVTIALQSSTATAMMTASFVERGLVRSRMAQLVLLGANVGTAITAWVVVTGVAWLSPLLLLAGIVLYRNASAAKQGGGVMLLGIGLMLLSLHLLSNATTPMRESAALISFVTLLDNAWPVALLLSATIAVVASSSLAAIVLVLSLAATGALSPALIVVLVLGANLGGAIPPVIATLGGFVAARRVALGNLIVRGAGCVIALPLAGYGATLFDLLPFGSEKLAVDAHLGFNIAVATLAWPFSLPLSRLTAALLPEDPQTTAGPRYLDMQALSTPVLALAGATREVLGIGDLVERMLQRASDAFESNDLSKLSEIKELEKRVDALQQEIKIYLSKLCRGKLSDDDARHSITIIDYAINLEHVGDIIEKGLTEQIGKKASLGLRFSEEGYRELKKMFDFTIDNMRVAQTMFVTRDFNLAKRMMDLKVEVRRMEKHSAAHHLERLRKGRADSLQTSSLHLDVLRDLKRINAHLVSVAHPILDESGLLSESRLLSTG